MSKFGWKNWLMLVLVATLFVVAGVMVAVGVVTHDEPGFVSPENAWDHMPLTVACADYGDGSDACRTSEDVINTINARLGFNAMTYAGSELRSDIVITMNAPVNVGEDGPCSDPGECFALIGNGTTYVGCEVNTMGVAGGGNLPWLVTYHGLGHCLGLDHDDYEMSIMRPVQEETPGGAIPPWISDSDRELLREKYQDM